MMREHPQGHDYFTIQEFRLVVKFEPENELDENIIDTDHNYNDLEDQEKRQWMLVLLKN